MATPIPRNEAPFVTRDLVAATGGRLVAADAGAQIAGVSTDTRALGVGSAFVALVGEKYDGHAFVRNALDAGATLLVVSRVPDDVPADVAVLLVPDTLAALGAIARAHRRRWAAEPHARGPRTVVAIGGSAGKTTTTRAIAAVLEAECPGEVHATRGNLNNQIGVPMTLLALDAHHRFAVVEVGTNHRGEVAALGAVVEPDVAIVTLAAAEHLEGLGDLEEVAREEGDLFAAVREGGIVVGNAEDARVVGQLTRGPARARATYGGVPGANVRIVAREAKGLAGSVVLIAGGAATEPRELAVPLLGRAGALAAVAAVTVVELVLGRAIDLARVAVALATINATRDGRLVPVERADGTIVLDDSYNANPGSVRSSVETAREIADGLGRRLVLVLGEMRELGASSPAEHDEVGRDIARSRAALVVAIAGDAARFAARAREAGLAATFVATSDEAITPVLAAVTPGDVVLVKGSRSVGTERIVAALLAAAPRC